MMRIRRPERSGSHGRFSLDVLNPSVTAATDTATSSLPGYHGRTWHGMARHGRGARRS